METTEIIKRIASGDIQKTREAVKAVQQLADRARTEYFEKTKTGASEELCTLGDSFIEMCRNPDANARIGGLRGLNAMAITREYEERSGEMAELVPRLISDDNGNVRLACANAFGYLRPPDRPSRRKLHDGIKSGGCRTGGHTHFTEDDYVELYLVLQSMHDRETGKKRVSLNNILCRLSCQYLEGLMQKRGYTPVEYDEDVP